MDATQVGYIITQNTKAKLRSVIFDNNRVFSIMSAADLTKITFDNTNALVIMEEDMTVYNTPASSHGGNGMETSTVKFKSYVPYDCIQAMVFYP